jgi:hypothetical protein
MGRTHLRTHFGHLPFVRFAVDARIHTWLIETYIGQLLIAFDQHGILLALPMPMPVGRRFMLSLPGKSEGKVDLSKSKWIVAP